METIILFITTIILYKKYFKPYWLETL